MNIIHSHKVRPAESSARIKTLLETIANALLPQAVDPAQGPNERRALAYLDGFLSFPFLAETERGLIIAAKQAIRRARFQKLQRQINQLQRSTREVKLTPAALTDKLMEILRSYPLEQQAEITPAIGSFPVPMGAPDIILSESFDSP